MSMKRFWLFIFEQYYPSGGMLDFYDSYDSFEEAKAKGESRSGEYSYDYDIFDRDNGTITSSNGRVRSLLEIIVGAKESEKDV
jgi:hypothetical protein